MDRGPNLPAVAGEVEGIDALFSLCGAAGVNLDAILRALMPVLEKVPVELLIINNHRNI